MHRAPGEQYLGVASRPEPVFPAPLMPPGRVAPVPRRIRGVAGGEVVVDSYHALYAWEVPYYPQWYFPMGDVRTDLLIDEERVEDGPFGLVSMHALAAGHDTRPAAARRPLEPAIAALGDTIRFEWAAMDAWFEEDEQVFVHPRNPYARVDALRSTRPVRVELDGVLLAETGSPVMVFETGLPTRYYINRTEVDFTHLVPSDTVTACPYKGTTSGYWSAQAGGRLHPDVGWSYDFPTRQLLPIAGLIAFYSEKVDITVDGQRLGRPSIQF